MMEKRPKIVCLRMLLPMGMLAALLLSPRQLAAQEHYTAMFLFRQNSDILVSNYMDNNSELEQMNTIVRPARVDIRAGRSHIRIVSYVRPAQARNMRALNNASIQGSVVRAYLKVWNGITHEQCTFYIDTTQNINNKVSVEYVDGPITAADNSQIHYTFSENIAVIDQVMERYGRIPYRNSNRQLTRNDYVSFDSQGKVDTSEVWRYDSLNKVREALEREREMLAWERQELARKKEQCRQDSILRAQEQQLPPPAVVIYLAPATAQPAGRTKKQQSGFTPLVGIKTNLLPWVGFTPNMQYRFGYIPNLGAEFYLARHWSLALDGSYTNQTIDKSDAQCFAYSAAYLEGRYWFNTKGRFAGLYIGIAGGGGQFDFKYNEYSALGFTGNLYSAGLSLGGVIPIIPQLFLEIGVRGGYQGVNYDSYLFEDPAYYWEGAANKSGFGLLGGNLSIGYRFGNKSH